MRVLAGGAHQHLAAGLGDLVGQQDMLGTAVDVAVATLKIALPERHPAGRAVGEGREVRDHVMDVAHGEADQGDLLEAALAVAGEGLGQILPGLVD